MKGHEFTIILLLCILVGGIGLVTYSQAEIQVNTIKNSLERQQEEIKNSEVKIEHLFDLKDKNFIAEDMTSEKINSAAKEFKNSVDEYNLISKNQSQLKSEIVTLLKKKSDKLLTDAEEKLTAQEEINKLYQKNDQLMALNGRVINKNLAIADNLTSEKINTVKIKYVKKELQTVFEKTVSELVLEAEIQETQISNTTKKIDQLYTEDGVITVDQMNSVFACNNSFSIRIEFCSGTDNSRKPKRYNQNLF